MYTPIGPSLSLARVDRLVQLATCVDISPGPGGSRMSDYAETEKVFGPDIADLFPGRYHVTVVALYPSSQIVAHRDPAIRGRRYHLPLALDPFCWVFSDGTWQQLEVGQIYQMDPTLWHGSVNWGALRRLHLLVDCAG